MFKDLASSQSGQMVDTNLFILFCNMFKQVLTAVKHKFELFFGSRGLLEFWILLSHKVKTAL